MSDNRLIIGSSSARLSVLRPSTTRIRGFVGIQRERDLTYRPVGGTRSIGRSDVDQIRGDYNVDRHQVFLGRGGDTYRAAQRALRSWRMFELGWVELCWPDTHISPGSAVAVLARVANWWVLTATRIVYVDEDTNDDGESYTFAYGTLPGHLMRGEERFTVSWDRSSDHVTYEIAAFSKPSHALSWIGYPVVRRLQDRFRVDSGNAMRRAIASA